ncbi:MAG: hypothetical protein ACE5KT_01575 [Methanosarcinales archaeon]
MIKPLLDKIGVADIVNSYTDDQSEISHGSRSLDNMQKLQKLREKLADQCKEPLLITGGGGPLP